MAKTNVTRARKKESATRVKKKQTAARKSAAVVPSTPDRIIEHSIFLFNRHSVQEVSIEDIASALNMSRGNLNYHFRRKRDLILATVDVLNERLRVALERPEAVATPVDAAQYIVRIIETFWEFRFFFNGLSYLLRNHRPVRKRYLDLRDWVLKSIEGDVRYLADRGYFLPEKSPNSYGLLVDNMWALFLNWLRMAPIESPLAPRPEKQALYDCVTHFWSLCHLWLEPRFALQLHNAFTIVLPGVSKPKKSDLSRRKLERA